MRKLAIFIVSSSLLIGGLACGKPGGSTGSTATADPAKSELASRLQSMTPEERARYVQDHPQEVSSTFSQVPGGGQ